MLQAQGTKTGKGTTGSTATGKVSTATSKVSTATAKGSVDVTCGARKATVQGASGRTVATLRKDMATKMNITENHTTTLVNGERASANRRLKTGDKVEFLREAGVKG